MRKKVLWITQTALLLALLICLQWLGSQIPAPMAKQLVTGTCVNGVLAITILMVGYSAGITLALISPVMAFLLAIAPNIVTVLPIMVGNVCFVVLLKLICRKNVSWSSPAAVVCAAAVKATVLYLLVVELICKTLAPALMGKKVGQAVVLAPKMLKMLPAMFSWPQIVTALAGGALALLILPALKKALRK